MIFQTSEVRIGLQGDLDIIWFSALILSIENEVKIKRMILNKLVNSRWGNNEPSAQSNNENQKETLNKAS